MLLKKTFNSPTIMSWASAFVRFGSMIFVFPLILTNYSSIEQSFWFFTNTIIGFAMLADMGFGSVLTRAVAYFKSGSSRIPRNREEYGLTDEFSNGEPNYGMLKDLLTTSNRIYLFLAVVVIVLLSTFGTAFIWNLMALSKHRTDFWLAYILLIFYCVVSINSMKWNSFVRGLNYVAVEARFKVFTSSIRIAIFVVLLIFNAKPVALIAVMLLEACVINWYMRRYVINWMKTNHIVIGNKLFFNRDIFKSIWPATWRLAGLFLGGYLVDSGNAIIIAQISDAQLIAGFLFTSRIISFLKTISQTPFYSNIPTIYGLAAQKKLNELRIKSSQYIFLGLFIFICGSIVIIFAGDWTLQLIHSNTRFLGTNLLILMCLTVFLDLHSCMHASIYTSTNHVPFLIPALISGIVIVALGFNVLPLYGLLGILMVRFLVELSFDNWYTVFMSLRLLNWPFHKYVTEMPTIGLNFVKEKLFDYNPIKLFKKVHNK